MCKDGCCYKLKSTEKEFCFAKNGLYKTFNCIGGKWVWSSPEKKFGQINSKWPETHNKHIEITIFRPRDKSVLGSEDGPEHFYPCGKNSG